MVFNVRNQRQRVRVHLIMNRQMQQIEKLFRKTVKDYIRRQFDIVARHVGQGVFDVDHAIDSLRGYMIKDLSHEYTRMGQVFFSIVHSGALTVKGNLGPKETKSMSETFWSTYHDWTIKTAAEKVTQINDTTKNTIKNLIDKNPNDSYTELAKKITDKGGISSLSRAFTIARTEVHTGSMNATHQAVRSTGIRHTKEWVAVNDDSTRDDHADADGQEVNMEEDFSVGEDSLEYPGDSSGSPEETINCRCVCLYHTVNENTGEEEETQTDTGEGPPPVEEEEDTTTEGEAEEDKPTPVEEEETPKPNLNPNQTFSNAPEVEAHSSVTKTERDAIRSYQGAGYGAINGRLRSNQSVDSIIKSQITSIDSAMKRSEMIKNTSVYRVITLSRAEALHKGGLYVDKGFVSTTKDLGTAYDLLETLHHKNQSLLVIEVPAGTHVIEMEKVIPGITSSDEKEILLPRNQEFEVRSIKNQDYPDSYTTLRLRGTHAGKSVIKSSSTEKNSLSRFVWEDDDLILIKEE